MTVRGIHRATRRSICILLVLAGLLLLLAAGDESRVSSERFTGEIIFPIYVSDVEVSAAFYRDVLGFEFLGYYDYATNSYTTAWQDSLPPTYAGFVAGDQKFGLHKPVNESQAACVGCGRYYFRVLNLDAEHERITSLGVSLSSIHSSSLLRRFYVPDPDGLMVFLAEIAANAPLDPW